VWIKYNSELRLFVCEPGDPYINFCMLHALFITVSLFAFQCLWVVARASFIGEWRHAACTQPPRPPCDISVCVARRPPLKHVVDGRWWRRHYACSSTASSLWRHRSLLSSDGHVPHTRTHRSVTSAQQQWLFPNSSSNDNLQLALRNYR